MVHCELFLAADLYTNNEYHEMYAKLKDSDLFLLRSSKIGQLSFILYKESSMNIENCSLNYILGSSRVYSHKMCVYLQ